MTLTEFKAWLDGYLDGKDGLTADQVAVVQAKLMWAMPDRMDLTRLRPYLEPQRRFELPTTLYGLPTILYGPATSTTYGN